MPQIWAGPSSHLALDDRGTLSAIATPAVHAALESFLAAELRRRRPLVTIAIRELEGPLQSVLRLRERSGNEGVLPPNWRVEEDGRSLEPRFRGAFLAVAGEEVVVRGIRSRACVSGLQTLSGGIASQIVATPDPMPSSCGDGFTLSLRAEASLETERIRVEVDFANCRTDFRHQARILVPAESAVHSDPTPAGSPESPSPRPRRVPFLLDLPRQEVHTCRARRALRHGEESILKIETTSRGRGQMITVRALPAASTERTAAR